MITKPGLKATTKRYYETLGAALRADIDSGINGAEWIPAQAREWWSVKGSTRSSSQSNNMLQAIRRICQAMIEHGVWRYQKFHAMEHVRDLTERFIG